MQLESKFTIEAPIEKAWEALNTPEMIAPCFPGATLTEYEGDSFTGTVKVKLGPISLTYKGKGTYVTRDEDAHKVVIEATGRDSRGNGTASATVTGSMVADGPDKTAVTMVTDMTITGRPAQFGRGVISDVADKIIGQFAPCLTEKLTPQRAPTVVMRVDSRWIGGGTPSGGGPLPTAHLPVEPRRGVRERKPLSMEVPASPRTRPAALAPPTLVIDFGTTTSSAAIVTDTGVRLVKEPATGSWSWPSAVCLDREDLLVGTLAENVKRAEPTAFRDEFKRDLGASAPLLLGDRPLRPVQLVAAVVAALRRQAEFDLDGPLDRVVLTVPATYDHRDPRWSAMIEAGELAGFAEVELLPEPAAAAAAPMRGTPVPPGEPMLVYDFGGGTFDTAVVRDGVVLGCAALDDCGGRDVDSLLAERAVRLGGERMAEQLRSAADDDPDAVLDVQHVRMDLAEFVRRTKHHLTEATVARDYLRPARQRIELEQDELSDLVAPLLERTIDCCRELLRRLAIDPADLGAIALVGGSSRMPVVSRHVEQAFGQRPRQSDDLALAVVSGAAEWVRGRGPRTLMPSGPSDERIPVCWDFPDGTVTLVRWLMARGDRLTVESEIAVVRIATGELLRLTLGGEDSFFNTTELLANPVVLDTVHAEPGSIVASGDWLVTVRAEPEPERSSRRPRPRRAEPTHADPVWGADDSSSDAVRNRF